MIIALSLIHYIYSNFNLRMSFKHLTASTISTRITLIATRLYIVEKELFSINSRVSTYCLMASTLSFTFFIILLWSSNLICISCFHSKSSFLRFFNSLITMSTSELNLALFDILPFLMPEPLSKFHNYDNVQLNERSWVQSYSNHNQTFACLHFTIKLSVS